MSVSADQLRRRTDSAMLESLSAWFALRDAGYQGAHSFNDMDVSEMLKRAAAQVAPGPRALTREDREAAERTWQEFLEMDDRTSPEEYPDMALITRDELASVMSASLPPAQEHAPNETGKPESSFRKGATSCPGNENISPPPAQEAGAEDDEDWGGLDCPEAQEAPLQAVDDEIEIEIEGRRYRKFILYPETVDDGTLRCISCGQIDEPEYHNDAFCPALSACHALTREDRESDRPVSNGDSGD